jgi:hypothetical protein
MDKLVNSSPLKDVNNKVLKENIGNNELNVVDKKIKSKSRRSLTKSLDSLPSLKQTSSNSSLLSNDDYSKYNNNNNNNNNNRSKRNNKSRNGNYYLSTQINELSNNNNNNKVKRMGKSGKLPNLINPGLIIESAHLSNGNSKISNQKNKIKVTGETITPSKNYNKNKSVFKYKVTYTLHIINNIILY